MVYGGMVMTLTLLHYESLGIEYIPQRWRLLGKAHVLLSSTHGNSIVVSWLMGDQYQAFPLQVEEGFLPLVQTFVAYAFPRHLSLSFFTICVKIGEYETNHLRLRHIQKLCMRLQASFGDIPAESEKLHAQEGIYRHAEAVIAEKQRYSIAKEL